MAFCSKYAGSLWRKKSYISKLVNPWFLQAHVSAALLFYAFLPGWWRVSWHGVTRTCNISHVSMRGKWKLPEPFE
jgi:hypothetical protein